MAVKKIDNYWLVDIQPGGVGCKRYRKRFKTKSQALNWELDIKSRVLQDSDFSITRKDSRLLSDIFTLWFDYHGQHLKAGKDTYNRLLLVSKRLNNPALFTLSNQTFIDYRTFRINQGITPNGVNREMSYCRAAFNELIRLKLINIKNPLDGIRQLKIDQNELCFLSQSQINRLINVVSKRDNSSLYFVVLICLSTGARWSEAVKLHNSHISSSTITFNRTKSGRSRTVPVSSKLFNQLFEYSRSTTGQLFSNPIKAFRSSLVEANITLPRGQSSHVLRHTFASHFIMNGGDILTLQKILGHASLDMTMRYAHLSPGHLQQAVKYSPLLNIEID